MQAQYDCTSNIYMYIYVLNSGGHVHEEIRRKLSTKTTTSAAAPHHHHHHHHGHAPPPPPPPPSSSSKQLALEQQTEDASESRQGEKEGEEKERGFHDGIRSWLFRI